MRLWKSVVGKIWMTIIGLVAVILLVIGLVLLQYIDIHFTNSDDIKILFIITGVIGFSLTTFFAFFLLTKITQPLRELKKAANRITMGEYRTRVETRSNDEIGELALAFNHMAGQLEDTITHLNHEKEHLSSVLTSMNDAVISLNGSGEVILTNPQGLRLLEEWSTLNWSTEESGLPLGDNLPPEPLQRLFDNVSEELKPIHVKLHVRKSVYSVVMTPMGSPDGVRGAVAVLRDVTEEFRLDKLRKDFVANVSHELRTPLSMLQGYSEALLDDIAGTPEERKELAQVIYDESLRMGRLVKDLLDLARMEAGHIALNRNPVEAGGLIARIQRKFAVLAKEQNVSLTMLVPAEELNAPLDEDRMEQVLTNLVDNAMRHTPSGSPIRISGEKTVWKGKPAIKIEVSDGGQGIASEDLPFIFERFYKADKARTRQSTGGTGLGLAIVKNIVEAHQGHVSVRSEVGKGTTFSVIVPAL